MEARKLLTFGRLLGGAGGCGEVCLGLQILRSMVSGSNHALLSVRGCGELILSATPSAAGPSWLLGVAIWGAWCLLFDILGIHFGTSGALWRAILAPWDAILELRDHPGGPWEQQDTRGCKSEYFCGFWNDFGTC